MSITVETYYEAPITVETYAKAPAKPFPWWILILLIFGYDIYRKTKKNQ